MTVWYCTTKESPIDPSRWKTQTMDRGLYDRNRKVIEDRGRQVTGTKCRGGALDTEIGALGKGSGANIRTEGISCSVIPENEG